MYIGPDKIKNIIQEILRVSRKAVVFLEQNCASDSRDPYGLGSYGLGQWQRNYVDLLKQFIPEERIRSGRLPAGVWPGEDWSQHGYLIKVLI